MIIRSILMFSVLVLSGCAGIGVIESNDPLTKLQDAQYLSYNQGRPLIAERLIFEARDIYKANQDFHGVGNSNRQYGNLLLSHTITQMKNHYVKNGFLDRTVTFESRKEKAREYFSLSLENYKKAEPTRKSKKEYDALTNLYLNMAYVSKNLNNIKDSCIYLDSSIEAYENNIKTNPGVTPSKPRGYNSVKEYLEARKVKYGC